jgi:predicted small lipoprotein YifL
MRKLFFILLVSAIVFSMSNCGGDGPDATGFNPNDTIPRTTALAMYAHYMDSTVDKSDSAIIRQIFPSVSSLKDVLKTKNLVGIKFMVAAYLDTDPVVARRNQPMVLLQLKTEKGGPPVYQYYDLGEVSKQAAPQPPYCPPPPGCVMPVES